MKIMPRDETAYYIKNEIDNGRRVVAPIYGDGEYLLMTNQRDAGGELRAAVGSLLRRAVREKGQFVCTVPASAIDNIWTQTSRYIRKQGQHALYGVGAWTRWDILNNNEILYRFFSKKVLLVSSLSDRAKIVFPNFDMYSMPSKNASTKYTEALTDISNICGDFDNILFSCGPIGKVIISDIVNKTDANIIDIGSLLNVILEVRPYSSWARSCAKKGRLPGVIGGFLEKI